MGSIAQYGAAMAVCAGHEKICGKTTSQPEETFRMSGLTNASPSQLEGQHTAGAQFSHVETEPGEPPYSCYSRPAPKLEPLQHPRSHQLPPLYMSEVWKIS